MRAYEYRRYLFEDGPDLPEDIQFSSTKLTDKHIAWIIEQVASVTKASIDEVKNEIVEKIKKIHEYKDKAPLLYSTMAENAIEAEVFGLMKEHGIRAEDAPDFSRRWFRELIHAVKAQYREFFPLRNIHTNKSLKEAYIFVPDQANEYPQYAKIDTAAATANGDFIFNTEFMQHLLDYATIKGVKPKSKKYKSNGGSIPDAYSYIEFLLIHEYMHYTQADFSLSRIYNVSPTLSNWVGDFRNNYNIVSAGIDQLPIGLFSKDINPRKQRTYKEMVDLVQSEWDKLKDHEQQELQNIMDSMMDDHDHQEGEEGEGQGQGQGKPGGEPSGEEGEGEGEGEGKGQGQGEPGDEKGKGQGQGEPGDEKGKGQGQGEGGDGPTAEELEKRAKEIEDNLKKGQQRDGIEPSRPDPTKKRDRNAGVGKGGKGNKDQDFSWKPVPPRFKWDKLLAKIVSNAQGDPEETYGKMDRTSIATTADTLRKTGRAVVKPGEVPGETKLKIAMVLDASGSMTSALNRVHSEISKLLKNYNRLDNGFVIIKFSDSFVQYSINIKKGKFSEIQSPSDKPDWKGGDVQKLFSQTISGGTDFNDSLTTKVKEYINNGYYVVICSDDDIVRDNDNAENVRSLITSAKASLIMATKDDYISAIKAFGARSNITFFN